MTPSVKGAFERIFTRPYWSKFCTNRTHIDVFCQITCGSIGTTVDCHRKFNQLFGRGDIECGIYVYLLVRISQKFVNPFNATGYVVAYDSHLSTVGAKSHHILVYSLIQYWPSDEVQPLRGLKFHCDTVDKFQQCRLGKQLAVPHLLPYLLESGVGKLIGQYTVDKGSHAIGATSSRTEHPVVTVVYRIYSVVVVKCEVEIPARCYGKLVLQSILVHICTPIRIGVAGEFSHYEMPEETLKVELAAIANFLIGILDRP